MKTVIIVITGDKLEAFSNLKAACEIKGWAYNTLNKKDISAPYEHQGSKILRLEVIRLS